MLEGAPPPEEAARIIARFIGARQAPLFAHNAPFDAKVMWASRMADFVEADCPVCCTLELSRKALPDEPSHALDALAKSLSLVRGSAHKALSDCLCTAQLVDVCYTEMERRGGLTIQAQGQMSLSLSLPACPKCGSNLVAKDGFTQAGTQRYRCKSCGKGYTEGASPAVVKRCRTWTRRRPTRGATPSSWRFARAWTS